jgi:hypothetical protein
MPLRQAREDAPFGDLEPVVIALDDRMRVSRDAVKWNPHLILIGVAIVLLAAIILIARWIWRRVRRHRVQTGETEGASQFNA